MITVTGLLETLSPLCQGTVPENPGDRGNTMAIQKSRFLVQAVPSADAPTEWATKTYPVLTGNGLRGRLRDIAAEQLLALLGYSVTAGRPSVPELQAHPTLPPLTEHIFILLFAGGHLGGDGDTQANVDLVRQITGAVPMVRLFGGVGQGQWIPHRFSVSEAIPTVPPLKPFCTPWHGPAEVLEAAFRAVPGEDTLVQVQRFTRYAHGTQTFARQAQRDEHGNVAHEDKGKGQAVYALESVVAGVPFYHQLVLYDADPVSQGVVYKALQAFAARGQFGGKAAIGFGRLRVRYWTDQGDCIDAAGATGFAGEAIAAYDAFVQDHAAEILAALKAYDKPPKTKAPGTPNESPKTTRKRADPDQRPDAAAEE